MTPILSDNAGDLEDEDSDEVTVIKHSKRKLPLVDSDDEDDVASIQSSDSSVKKRKLEKSPDDTVPLPKPFPLPKHFRKDVEIALKTKKMTKETRSSFFSSVASAMLYYKRYPSSDDYKNVAQSILTNYDFLKSPVGTPDVSFVYYVKFYTCMYSSSSFFKL